MRAINELARGKSIQEKLRIYRPFLQGTIHVNSEEMVDIHEAYLQAINGQVCDKPMIELFIPQILDPSVNKAGDSKVVASLFV